MTITPLAENLARIRERVARSAQRAGRREDEITLLAVSKTQPPERIQEAHTLGLCAFGENYVQEARAKLSSPLLQSPTLEWHFIGHLQSNKAREVVGRFRFIQSVESISLAQEISKRAVQSALVQDILLEVKLDPTQTKFGLLPDALNAMVAQIEVLPGVRLQGLMGMAPYVRDPEEARPSFRTLYRCFRQLPASAQNTLSMGMSGDFEVAIEEGSTLIRVGTALFGERPTRLQ
jgi:pyridoxal phosphate enzyme (YggS family)